MIDQDFPQGLTVHDLRHTAASLAISAGANVKAVQRMLGHASAAMTLDTYADLFDDDLDAVAEALDIAKSRIDSRGTLGMLHELIPFEHSRKLPAKHPLPPTSFEAPE
ncbi:tyrosine-type recombinase/integrase [Lacisediminihabitans sp.]|uniref:tyrosine-type recombinase/integrase n=1 Tax=Lacisediminihabitans sp. TaxID=2787631 RepID=UPI00374D39E9